MREQVRHAAGAAIFYVVMDRMGIAARGLKRGEHGRRHGSARNDKTLAQRKILEPALLRHHAMQGGVEVGHGGFPASVLIHAYRSGVVAATWRVIPGRANGSAQSAAR